MFPCLLPDRLGILSQSRSDDSGLRIVNASRGGIIDEDALHEPLATGRIAGAGLDVFVSEPPVGSPR